MYSLLWHFLNKDETDEPDAYANKPRAGLYAPKDRPQSGRDSSRDRKKINIYKYNEEHFD